MSLTRIHCEDCGLLQVYCSCRRTYVDTASCETKPDLSATETARIIEAWRDGQADEIAKEITRQMG